MQHGTKSRDFTFDSSDEDPYKQGNIDDEELVMSLQNYTDSGLHKSLEMLENELTEKIQEELDPKLSRLSD